MRNTVKLAALTGALVSWAAVAAADSPVVTLLGPGGTIFSPSFPVQTTVDFTIAHTPINAVKDLDVTIDDASLLGGEIKPFVDFTCSAALAGLATSCSVDDNTGTVSIPWQVPAPGTYAIVVTVAHGNDEGTDGDEVSYEIVLVDVEYPAPPAVANAYINATFKKAAPKVRGCIVSSIANNHAMDSKYGPKGGPYAAALIEADVVEYRTACGG